MMIGNVEENANWDTQVLVFPGTEGNVVEWAEANSVEHELLLMFPANLVDDPRQLTAYGLDEFADSGDDAMQILNLVEGRLPVADSPNPEVLIDNGIQHFLDWQVGQTQTILFGSQVVEIKVVGITEGAVSRSVYFHRADLSERVGIEATSVLLTLPGDLDSQDELGLMSIGIIEKQDMIDSLNSLMEQQQGFFVAIQMLGIIIAFVVLFNTLIMNLAERDSELATLRVLGAPLNRIGLMMLGEHFAIGLIGGVLGAIFSVLGTKWLMSQMVQWAFYLEVNVDLAISVGLAGIVLFISVGLTPLGMWRVRQMDLVEKVKEFSN
jgi:putative ABC transport system permease protein